MVNGELSMVNGLWEMAYRICCQFHTPLPAGRQAYSHTCFIPVVVLNEYEIHIHVLQLAGLSVDM
jgi:hypothetical protein